MKADTIIIEVVYATPSYCFQKTLNLPGGALLADALDASKVKHYFPETKSYLVGIWGEEKTLNHVLQDGDRVEVYRPLKASTLLYERAKIIK